MQPKVERRICFTRHVARVPSRHWPNRTVRVGNGSLQRRFVKVHGFTDLDGPRSDAWRYVVEVQDAGRPADTTRWPHQRLSTD